MSRQFLNGRTVLGLVLTGAVTGKMEGLYTSLQRKTQTISGMKAAIFYIQSVLKKQKKRCCLESFWTGQLKGSQKCFSGDAGTYAKKQQ